MMAVGDLAGDGSFDIVYASDSSAAVLADGTTDATAGYVGVYESLSGTCN